MVFCPVCKSELQSKAEKCHICGHPLSEEEKSGWILLGTIEDNLSAEFARETLTSSEIPVVVISSSGFFGHLGLPLNPIYKPGAGQFQVMVPQELAEEASELLEMTLGEKWQRKEQ